MPRRLQVAIAVLSLVGQVLTSQAQNLPRRRPLDAARQDHFGACAGYGSGFVQIAGTSSCVRISGHIRVEYGWGTARGKDRPLNDERAVNQALPTERLPSDELADPAPPYARLRPGNTGQPAAWIGRARPNPVPRHGLPPSAF